MTGPVEHPPHGSTPGGSAGRRATRERLLQAAYSEFRAAGYIKTTINEVCERAGFSRGAFYSNFSTKEELFEAVYFRANNKQVVLLRRAFVESIQQKLSSTAPCQFATATLISSALRELEFGTGDELEWFGLVTELRGVSIHDFGVRKVLLKAQADLYMKLESLLESILLLTGEKLALPTQDVISLAIGLFEKQLIASHMGANGISSTSAADSLELLLRAITVS